MTFIARIFRRRKYGTRSPSRIFPFLSRRKKAAPNLLRFGTNAARSRRRRIILIILAIFILSILSLIATRSSFFHIKQATVHGDTDLSREMATALISDWLGQNIFLVNTTEIANHIQSEYPTIENLSVSRRLPDRLIIRADDFPVSWVLTKVGSDAVGRFLLNTAGYITEVATADNAVDLPVLELVSEINLSAKNNMLDPSLLARLLDLGKNIQSRFGLKVIKYKVMDTAREIHLLLNNNWVIRLSIGQNWDNAMTNLADTLRGQDLSKLDFEYIDLRVPDKIFFKEKS